MVVRGAAKMRLQTASGEFLAISLGNFVALRHNERTDQIVQERTVEKELRAKTSRGRMGLLNWNGSGVLLLALVCMVNAAARAQSDAAKPSTAAAQAQNATAKPASANSAAAAKEAPPVTLSPAETAEQRANQAWKVLTDAVNDPKRTQTQTRIQALAALSMLRSPRSAKMIAGAMTDPDLDIRTAAALAAGQTRDPNLTANLRNLLDDKEPEVAFTAALTLWKLGDKSGEDILMSVVDGERSAGPTMVHGTEHKIDKDLHDPEMLARLGAMQGLSMLLGPFGFGITAIEFIHQSGGDLSRVAAIEQIAQERTEPVHQKLLAALKDKDAAVRAAAAKALAEYRDQATSNAIYPLFEDKVNLLAAEKMLPVRLTAAAAYLRTTGVPGPLPARTTRARRAGQ
jgi:HEAT repeat protein